MRICNVEGCGEKHFSHGYCRMQHESAGLTIMLFVIAVGFWFGGLFG